MPIFMQNKRTFYNVWWNKTTPADSWPFCECIKILSFAEILKKLKSNLQSISMICKNRAVSEFNSIFRLHTGFIHTESLSYDFRFVPFFFWFRLWWFKYLYYFLVMGPFILYPPILIWLFTHQTTKKRTNTSRNFPNLTPFVKKIPRCQGISSFFVILKMFIYFVCNRSIKRKYKWRQFMLNEMYSISESKKIIPSHLKSSMKKLNSMKISLDLDFHVEFVNS